MSIMVVPYCQSKTQMKQIGIKKKEKEKRIEKE